jgi:hypothetical protein
VDYGVPDSVGCRADAGHKLRTCELYEFWCEKDRALSWVGEASIDEDLCNEG